MENITALDFKLVSNTTEMKRLTSGTLIKKILDDFSKKVNASLGMDLSLVLYSGHDHNIFNFLNTFGLVKGVMAYHSEAKNVTT